MEGTILHVCVSEEKSTVKTPVAESALIKNSGLQGDAHAGSWHRQVSLLDEADIDTMRALGLELKAGAFGENIVVGGLDLGSLGIGTCLKIGEARLELTQIGKVCHTRCAIYYQAGDCIMPRVGLFARVTEGGTLRPGMKVEVSSAVSRQVVQAAVLTISDSCSAGRAVDTAGPAVAELLENRLKARVCLRRIVPDELSKIRAEENELCERKVDLVLTVGGTGCGPRDVTPEATREVIEREVPGLAEAMRSSSKRITPHALLQRGICGICQSTLIINLPGSKKAATENLDAILPALPHAVDLLRGNTAHHGAPRVKPWSSARHAGRHHAEADVDSIPPHLDAGSPAKADEPPDRVT
jgi:molybdenum cofactor synthesis domain-containing protein